MDTTNNFNREVNASIFFQIEGGGGSTSGGTPVDREAPPTVPCPARPWDETGRQGNQGEGVGPEVPPAPPARSAIRGSSGSSLATCILPSVNRGGTQNKTRNRAERSQRPEVPRDLTGSSGSAAIVMHPPPPAG